MADTIDRDEELEKTDDSNVDESEKEEQGEVKDEEETQVDDNYEPPVRKTPIDYIRERKAKRNEQEEEQGSKEVEELTPEASRALDARLKPMNDYLNEKDISLDVKLFLADQDNRDMKKYEKVAVKFMKSHPTLTAEDAFYLASKKDLMSIGANRLKEAEKKAKGNSMKGGSSRQLERVNLDMNDPKVMKSLNDKLAREGKIDFTNL